MIEPSLDSAGAQPHLVAPVEALLVRAVGGLEPQLPADVADLGVGEVGNELRNASRRPGGIRIGERDDLALGLADGTILCSDLAPASHSEQANARLARSYSGDDLVRAVGGRIGGDDDLEMLGRIVEGQQVLDSPLDHGLLIVRRDDNRYERHRARNLPYRARTVSGPSLGRRRVEDVRPRERRQRAKEQSLDRKQHTTSLRIRTERNCDVTDP